MPSGTPSPWSKPASLVLLAALVTLICWGSITFTRGDGRVAAIWLSNGLVLGLMLSAPTAMWRRLLVTSLLGNFAAGLLVDDDPLLSLMLTSCNVVEISLAATLLRQRFGERFDLTDGQPLLWFGLVAVLLSPLFAAVMASAILHWHSGMDVVATLGVWWPADAMGMLIVTPLVLGLAQQGREPRQPVSNVRLALPWLMLVATSVLVFSQSRYPLLFLVFPALLWVTYLQGIWGASLGIATVAVLALGAITLGSGPFALIKTDSMHTRVLVLQFFLAVATLQGLLVASLLAQRDRLTLALKRSEQSLRTVTDNLPALVAHVDAEERYRFVNAHIGKVFGGDPQQMLGRTMREVRGEAIYQMLVPHLKRVLAGEAVSFEDSASAGGRDWHFQASYVPDLDAAGEVQGFFAMTFDITARKNAELRQAASEERLRTITDNLPALIAYIDQKGIYRFCNATHSEWFGKPHESFVGHHYLEALDASVAEAQMPHIRAALGGRRVDTELSIAPDGTDSRQLAASYVPHLDAQHRVAGVYMLLSDITSLKSVQAELLHLARHDLLTGLANRREFQERLEVAIERNRRLVRPSTLMFLDVDRFKAINDRYGHAAGDAVLKAFALRLQASVRAVDTVARLAGDEFVVILESVSAPAEAERIAAKVLASIGGQPIGVGEERLSVGASIGIAHDWSATLGPDALLHLADTALYAAKSAGRNTARLACHPPETRARKIGE